MGLNIKAKSIISSKAIGSINGYYNHWKDNLIPDAYSQEAENDFNKGSGNELTSKMRAAYSSSALALNTFGIFRNDPNSLNFDGDSNFEELRFEKKVPHWSKGHSPET